MVGESGDVGLEKASGDLAFATDLLETSKAGGVGGSEVVGVALIPARVEG